jgi:hypothetical protein
LLGQKQQLIRLKPNLSGPKLTLNQLGLLLLLILCVFVVLVFQIGRPRRGIGNDDVVQGRALILPASPIGLENHATEKDKTKTRDGNSHPDLPQTKSLQSKQKLGVPVHDYLSSEASLKCIGPELK